MTESEDKKARETKKEHVDPEKNKTAFQNKSVDQSGRDWTKPKHFKPGPGQV